MRHEPGPCGGCGADLVDAPEVGVERRQVFDLPPMRVRVTKHRLIARRCTCEATTCGTAPAGVTAPGAVRAAGHGHHRLPLCRAVLVQETHRGRAG
ncbi:MAG: IS66 family transposase zinc-finger binding domain-containing protein [Actinomycetota bacterium]|nr:IS66 family transposase zinc-finger binding domain-containing protein [Actinomycetota bacterium]